MSRAKYFSGSVFRRILIAFLVAQISFSPLLTVFAKTPLTSVVSNFIPGSFFSEENAGSETSYIKLVRELTKLSDSKIVAKTTRTKAVKKIDNFIKSEKKRLDDLKVPKNRQNDYFSLINKLRNEAGTSVRLKRGVNKLRIPEHPASFSFNDKEIRVKSLKNTAKKKISWSILKFIKNIVGIKTAFANDQTVLPKLADVKPDSEAIINQEIVNIAQSLNNNPVEIFNFVRNTISYEPYYGAKKGSTGCLHEKVCNDVDASSLTIALLRAGGIPAHYKKGIAVMPVQQLKTFLGVDETKTAYAAFALNDVPVYTLQNANAGKKLDDADFSIETHLAVEWVFAEAYYDYDEQGANINNTLSFENADDDYDVAGILSSYPKKQWIPMEAIIKPYVHTKKEILADTANFNSKTFWTDFFKYQGNLSPFNKYSADLQSATGKSIYDNLSTVSSNKKDYSILPSTLPYAFNSGTVDGKEILIETFSSMPDSLRYKVKISLLKDSDKSTVISKTFFGNEINNEEIDLFYDGATGTDKNVIENYGGIHATPSSLVNIIPYFQKEYDRFEGTVPVKIGDSLVLKFEYFLNSDAQKTDEKFSVAGNSEGIYVVLSKVLSDPFLDTDSNILLRGNVGIARKYLEQVEKDGTTLEQSLDYTSQTHFARAVVTQNRVLNEVGGIPTTFDFKGLSIDAAAYVNDYSNRGDFKNHRKDFRLIWGQQASYYEGQVFTDITGLNAISTVKGLQYAYGKPADYTIYTITSANESVIDGLALSENTKSNMHADIAKGNTIVTPNKMVNKGVWKGILYVSLDPVWTGTYAIGEQSQSNGGDSTDLVTISDWLNELMQSVITYIVETQEKEGESEFLYEDKPTDSQSVLCKISKSEFNDIKQNSGWKSEYGYPCAKGTKQFGTKSHAYTLATNAAKFEGANSKGNYNYWATYSSVKSKLKNDKYNDNLENLSDIDFDGTFKFNPIAGTYSWHGHYGTYNNYITAYYEPTTDKQGKGRVAYDDILSKLEDDHYKIQPCDLDDSYCDKQNWVLNILGYPTDNRKTAAEYVVDWGIDTKGQYQDFAGGQIYVVGKILWPDSTYYVPGKIAYKYNELGGSGGSLGFPDDDPKLVDNKVLQLFKDNNNGIVWDLNTNNVSVKQFKKYDCELYGDVDNTLHLGFILVHGVLDTLLQTASGLKDLLSITLSVLKDIVVSPGETYDSAKALVEEAKKIKLSSIKQFLIDTGDGAKKLLVDEYEASFGVTGCPARANYLAGRLVGEGLLLWFPVSKLKLLSKVKVVNKIGDSKVLTKLGDIAEDTAITIKGLAKSGPFKGKVIFGIHPDYIDEIPWYKNPLTEPIPKNITGLTLKDAIDAKYLKGDLQYGFYSLKKAIGDDYLIDLTNNKGHEIIFVLKQNGDMVIVPRGKLNLPESEYKIPHPVLSNAEAVRSAGSIKLKAKDLVDITNESGHLWPASESLDDVKTIIQNAFPGVEVNIVKKYN